MSSLKPIVVINDDPVQLHLIEAILEGGGYTVSAYLDPVEALTELPRIAGVRLCIVDLHMPVIDGWKVCRLLRSPDFRAFNNVPILVVSATFSGFDVEQITADLGANGFLASPFEAPDLLTHVEDLLAGKTPARRARLLVVEDDASVRRSVARAFEANDFDVSHAGTIAEAAGMWEDLRPDVVVLDYHLPDGTCEQLLHRYHTQDGQAVALVMTGDDDPTLGVTLLGLGADAYVRKPFDPTLLVELAGRARRERSLLRVEAILERRTQELRASEARFRTLFHSIPDLVITLDGDNRITAVNDASTRILHLEQGELVGLAVTELVSASEATGVMEAIEAIRTSGHGRFEANLQSRDGEYVCVEITASWPDPSGASDLVLVARDVTERKREEEERGRLEQQAYHTQRLESLGVLAGGIAHDFNNLLVGILGNAELALLEVPEAGMIHDFLTHIESAAQRAADLTNQILTFSGKGAAALTTVDLTQLVSEMGRLMEQAVSPKATLSYDFQTDLPPIKGDASQIGQVVMNLIMNASDSLGSRRGTIQVETNSRYLSESDLRSGYLGAKAQPGTYVCLTVRDKGCGIDPALLPLMFDPFFTTKPAGVGLGLATTLGIARAHGGLVAVDSEVDVGTEIRILFPARPQDVEHKNNATMRVSHVWGKGGTILVVDDEPAVRRLAALTLTRSGFDVLEASDGGEGIAMIKKHPQIDLVLLDLTMPDQTGIQVLETVRRAHPHLPVLLSSGYANEAIPEDLRTNFLQKPYRPNRLTEAVGDLLCAASLRVDTGR